MSTFHRSGSILGSELDWFKQKKISALVDCRADEESNITGAMFEKDFKRTRGK